MTIIAVTPATRSHTFVDARQHCGSSAAPTIRTSRRRLATRFHDALRRRQPMLTVSEQVLADIHGVHSVHR